MFSHRYGHIGGSKTINFKVESSITTTLEKAEGVHGTPFIGENAWKSRASFFYIASS
jgi:hypothetical protein